MALKTGGGMEDMLTGHAGHWPGPRVERPLALATNILIQALCGVVGLRQSKESSVEGFNVVLFITTHLEKVLIHAINHKPHCSTILVWHDSGTLYLDFLCCMMKMDRYQTRSSREDEVEFEQSCLFSSRRVTSWGDF